MQVEKSVMKTEAIFSDNRKHRYLLRKEWDTKKKKAVVIMTNPSTADTFTLDYTTMYILNNLAKLDFGAVDIVNMVSRMTRKLHINVDADSPDTEKENFGIIANSVQKADFVIIAWGKLGENNKAVRDIQDKLLDCLKTFKDKLYVIAAEKGGDNFHPLAPQIRFSWLLKKYEPVEKKPDSKNAEKVEPKHAEPKQTEITVTEE
jgi:hypothetical protein